MAWSRTAKTEPVHTISAPIYGLYSCVLVKKMPAVPEALAFEPDRRKCTGADGECRGQKRAVPNRSASRRWRWAHQEGEAWLAEGPAKQSRATSRLMEPASGNRSAKPLRSAPRAVMSMSRLRERRATGCPCADSTPCLALRDSCLMIKIDVEGREAGVLAGMADLLARNCGLIQIEAFDDAYRPALEASGFAYRGSIACDHFWEKP